MSLVSVICPTCNGKVQIDNTKEFGFCLYCGSKLYWNQFANNTTPIQDSVNIKDVIDQNNLDALGKMLDEGSQADIFIGDVPIIQYIANKRDESYYQLIKPLVDAGANLYFYARNDRNPTSNWASILYYAMFNENIALLKVLLECGMNPNFPNEETDYYLDKPLAYVTLVNEHISPYRKAINMEMGKLLVNYGADYKTLKKEIKYVENSFNMLREIVESAGKKWGLF